MFYQMYYVKIFTVSSNRGIKGVERLYCIFMYNLISEGTEIVEEEYDGLDLELVLVGYNMNAASNGNCKLDGIYYYDIAIIPFLGDVRQGCMERIGDSNYEMEDIYYPIFTGENG